MSPATSQRPASQTAISGSLRPVLALLVLSVAINYIDRGNLSIAAPMLKDELGISPSQLGLLLSSFFWTYSAFQIVAGWMVDRFHVNWVIAGGFFLWSAATAATGWVQGFALLLVLRLLLGVAARNLCRRNAQYSPQNFRCSNCNGFAPEIPLPTGLENLPRGLNAGAVRHRRSRAGLPVSLPLPPSPVRRRFRPRTAPRPRSCWARQIYRWWPAPRATPDAQGWASCGAD